MRLYLWFDVLSDYTAGVAFAIAESEAEARRLILAAAKEYDREQLARELDFDPEVIEGPFGFCLAGGG